MTTLRRGDSTIEYHVVGEGDGVPLLLTHGFASSSAMWSPNLSALSSSRPVITWDLRGHGTTRCPLKPSAFTHAECVQDMAAILDACDVPRAAVGGLSLGGYLSLAFHLAHRNRVAALLLVDTGPGYRRDEGRARWNRYAQAQAAALEAGTDPGRTSREVAAVRDTAALALAARGILPQASSEVIDSLESVEVPTLVVVGADDQPFLAAARYLASTIPGATELVLAGAGHASNLDQPAAFNAAVTDFLASVTSHDRHRPRGVAP